MADGGNVWHEVSDEVGTVTYTNSHTKECVVVEYGSWFTVCDDDGEVYWVNVKSNETAWERPGWNIGVENGIKYYFNNITKTVSLIMPVNYPAERSVTQLQAAAELSQTVTKSFASPLGVGNVSTADNGALDTVGVPSVSSTSAPASPMVESLQVTPAVAALASPLGDVAAPMTKEEKQAHDALLRKYKKQF
jgi:hypothetical protein